MRIVFFGSAQFAVPTLRTLVGAGHVISRVVTQPDRKKGRGLRFAFTPVKAAAEEAGLEVFQPQSANDPSSIRDLKEAGAELFVVVAYGQILSPRLLEVPTLFSINAHASLLPKHRGAAPINWALIKGDTETGVSIIKLTPRMDAGPIILQQRFPIAETDTTLSLTERLSLGAARLIAESVELIARDAHTLTPQDEKIATFAPKLTKKDGLIDWQNEASAIVNQIRGCLEWPGAFTYYRGKTLKVYRARLLEQGPQGRVAAPGEILGISREGIAVQAGRNAVLIEELQPEAGKRLGAAEFVAGHRLAAGEKLGEKK